MGIVRAGVTLLFMMTLAIGPADVVGAPPTGDELTAYLDSLVAEMGIPGITVGVAWPDGSVTGLAAGVADTVTAARLGPDSRMLQGSVGKTYFGAVALQLVAEGRIRLDDRL